MYPTAFPIQELTNTINTLKNGQVKTNLTQFAHDLWIIQGYAQNTLIGNPVPVLTLSADKQPLEILQEVLDAYNTPTPQALNPLLLQLLKVAIQELLQILQEYIGDLTN